MKTHQTFYIPVFDGDLAAVRRAVPGHSPKQKSMVPQTLKIDETSCDLPASMATITLAIKHIHVLRNPDTESVVIDDLTFFQPNIWLSITMTTATVASFL